MAEGTGVTPSDSMPANFHLYLIEFWRFIIRLRPAAASVTRFYEFITPPLFFPEIKDYLLLTK